MTKTIRTQPPIQIDPAQVARADEMLAALREANPRHRFARTKNGVCVGVWLTDPACFSICCLWINGVGVSGWATVCATNRLPNIDPRVAPTEWVE